MISVWMKSQWRTIQEEAPTQISYQVRALSARKFIIIIYFMGRVFFLWGREREDKGKKTRRRKGREGGKRGVVGGAALLYFHLETLLEVLHSFLVLTGHRGEAAEASPVVAVNCGI